MKPIQLPPQMHELIKKQFVLLESQNAKRKIDTVSIRLSGYSDVMHLISDIVKVSILALGEGETHGHMQIPEPEVNIAGVLGIILDLIPYEESDLLDALRESVLSDNVTVEVPEDDYCIENLFLRIPNELQN